MATEGCLPVFHTGGDAGQDEVDLETVLAQDPILQDDHLLSELLRSEGVRVCVWGGGGESCVSLTNPNYLEGIRVRQWTRPSSVESGHTKWKGVR